MNMKPGSWAGWLIFVPMLFMSVFYYLTSSLMSRYNGAVAVLCTGVCILVAFAVTKLASIFVIPAGSAARSRPFPTSRVYRPFVIWFSLACALFSLLLNIVVSFFSKVPLWGLSGLYPMISESIKGNMLLSFFMLVLIPPVIEEILLRGTVFSLCSHEGTAAAVFFSALTMPLLLVYPQGTMSAVVIGLGCALVCHMTNSIASAIAVHFMCRLTLWLCDLAVASPGFMYYSGVWSVLALFLFLISAYRSLRSFEGLLRDDLIQPSVPGSRNASFNLKNLFLNAGFILFALVFFVRFIYMIAVYA